MVFSRSSRKRNIHEFRQTYRNPFKYKNDKDSYKLEILIILLVIGILLI